MTVELRDLPSAIYWFDRQWRERMASLPARLHVHEVEPDSRLGSPKLAPKFLAHIAAAAHDVVTLTETRDCHHPRVSDRYKLWECPDCQGTGVYEAQRLYYRDPIASALVQVAKSRHPWPRGFIRPDRLILEFAVRGYSIPTLAADLIVREQVLAEYALLAFKLLAKSYADAPRTRIGWTEKSAAQREAESAA